MFAINTDGVGKLGIERQAFFNTNLMQPGIAEVILEKYKSSNWIQR